MPPCESSSSSLEVAGDGTAGRLPSAVGANESSGSACVGDGLGRSDGSGVVGAAVVGDSVDGLAEGDNEDGDPEGLREGLSEGNRVGSADGAVDDGLALGVIVLVGAGDGTRVGAADGTAVGDTVVGAWDGASVGAALGRNVAEQNELTAKNFFARTLYLPQLLWIQPLQINSLAQCASAQQP